MTVAELIARLREMPQAAPVVVLHHSEDYVLLEYGPELVRMKVSPFQPGGRVSLVVYEHARGNEGVEVVVI